MNDWTAGYVADIGYTFGYYAELNPLRLQMAFSDAGLAAPQCATACELGFGQGVSVNCHAAASPVEWFGTDFNPAQAALAQALAAASGATVRLYDQSFAEFCARDELPEFDFIGLHGIWSWISDENRHTIVDFVRRKLSVGGVLYVSYNTQPGWAATVPIRDLLAEHVEVMGARGSGIVRRIDDALAFADKLMATNPSHARLNKHVGKWLEKMKGENRRYLAHEYFNKDWHPMPFSRMVEWLAPAKLSYACSAHYLDHSDALNVTAEQWTLLKEIPDPTFRETVRDFMVNQRFRRDYWVRGARRTSAPERTDTLRATRVLLMQPRSDISLKITGALGEGSLQQAIYGPILDVLAAHEPRTIGEIEAALRGREITSTQLVQAMLVLVGIGHVVPVHDDATTAKLRTHTDKLNAYLCDKARGSGDINYLSSPVSGGGVGVSRVQQLFLLARGRGMSSAREWADFAWSVLSSQRQKIVKEGKPLDSAEKNLAELNVQAKTFNDKQLSILAALAVI